MEMVKLCSYFLLIKCLGSSAWPERCLGKAKVAGSIPAQGFLCSLKDSHFELLSGHVNDEDVLPKSVRILQNSVRNIESRLDWVGYKQYLEKNFNHHAAKARFSYSSNYYQILLTGDASLLVVLSYDKRIHVMKALATLSKFLGCYDEWKTIVGKYQLRWSDSDKRGGSPKGLEIFQKIYGNNNH